MDRISLVEQLLDAVWQVKAWVKTWVTNLVQGVSSTITTAINQLDAKKVNKTEYEAFKGEATAGIADNKAAIELIQEGMYSGITANTYELYFDDLVGIAFESPGSFVYNETYERLEC